MSSPVLKQSHPYQGSLSGFREKTQDSGLMTYEGSCLRLPSSIVIYISLLISVSDSSGVDIDVEQSVPIEYIESVPIFGTEDADALSLLPSSKKDIYQYLPPSLSSGKLNIADCRTETSNADR